MPAQTWQVVVRISDAAAAVAASGLDRSGMRSSALTLKMFRYVAGAVADVSDATYVAQHDAGIQKDRAAIPANPQSRVSPLANLAVSLRTRLKALARGEVAAEKPSNHT